MNRPPVPKGGTGVPTKPTAPDTKQNQRIRPAEFADFVAATATSLGDDWADDIIDTSQPSPTAVLTHPDGRRIGIRYLWRGAGVQTWALDVPPRTFDNDADAELYNAGREHLTAGSRYNVGVGFTNNPPAATAARNIRTRLLPAFDGKRPPLRAFPRKRSRRAPVGEKVNPVANTTTTSSTNAAAEKAKSSETKAKTPRHTAKKAQPIDEKTEPTKRSPAPRPRRPRATTAKATKAKTTKMKSTEEPKPQPPEATPSTSR
ncbi:hypothetical protein OK074_2076 [Actinobacteria bacterium OK074]|nr:hypothetical protein OK074_2076 [Actinobacteria bacterium OK074]